MKRAASSLLWLDLVRCWESFEHRALDLGVVALGDTHRRTFKIEVRKAAGCPVAQVA